MDEVCPMVLQVEPHHLLNVDVCRVHERGHLRADVDHAPAYPLTYPTTGTVEHLWRDTRHPATAHADPNELDIV